MTDQKTCSQYSPDRVEICGKPAAFRYTWPGRDEDQICADHAPHLAHVAEAMGLHLQLIPTEK